MELLKFCSECVLKSFSNNILKNVLSTDDMKSKMKQKNENARAETN